jgi:CTP-dependent riboflavin kinase
MTNNYTRVKGIIKQGYGVASGKGGDSRFPQGTIAMQKPFFKKLGLDLEQYFSGTLNISIHPHQYIIKNSKYTFRNVQWSSTEPAEDFSFFDCLILFNHNTTAINGLIYYPHPETKPEHFQSADILEIIAPPIENLKYEDEVMLECDRTQIHIV